jgi:hypothetical protein
MEPLSNITGNLKATGNLMGNHQLTGIISHHPHHLGIMEMQNNLIAVYLNVVQLVLLHFAAVACSMLYFETKREL